MLRYSASRSAVYTACRCKGRAVVLAYVLQAHDSTDCIMKAWGSGALNYTSKVFSLHAFCTSQDGGCCRRQCQHMTHCMCALQARLYDGVIVRQAVEVVVEDSLADDVQGEPREQVLHLHDLPAAGCLVQQLCNDWKDQNVSHDVLVKADALH